MKKTTAIILILVLITIPINIFASPPEFAGGVNNEYEYEEIVFITGKPIKFVGTVTIPENSIMPDKDDGKPKTVTYNLKNLVPEDKSIEGKLNRRVTYSIDYDNRSDKGQTIAKMSVKSYNESIELDGNKFILKDYQFSKSDIIDNRPASDFYSGNIRARKVYDITGGGRGRTSIGKVTIDISGGNMGYENFWGATETQIIDYIYNVIRESSDDDGGRGVERDRSEEDDEDEDEDENRTIQSANWQGTVKCQVSDSMTKELRYSDNEVGLSSFDGGYMRITNNEIVSKYDYDLPYMGTGANSYRRNKGTMHLSKEMVPEIERLIVPKFRDLGGHWAESYINKLYSLDVFDEVSTFFMPDVPMTREEFTKGIMRACDIRPGQEEPTRKNRRNKEPEVSPFIDISIENDNYKYIKSGAEKGIIQGISKDRFAPKKFLTRAQAITIIIRALGFENGAPTPGYITSFSDDRLIPSWAKDSIYMGQDIGLVQGDQLNRINPNDELTRAEASAMLVRFLEFLERDLQRDYRENIILFN
ncbi:MAG TPA: S-layer homology domain-containing protein [Oscillospiraceae bacterium]|nr:S-layer homology domain-containing protein [Oscillospiraceae bacterium]